MKKLSVYLVLLGLICISAGAAEKSTRKHYGADASLARRQARSMSPDTASSVLAAHPSKTPRTPSADEQLRALEKQTAKIQDQRTKQSSARSGVGVTARPLPASDKNQPINFNYKPPQQPKAAHNNTHSSSFNRRKISMRGMR